MDVKLLMKFVPSLGSIVGDSLDATDPECVCVVSLMGGGDKQNFQTSNHRY